LSRIHWRIKLNKSVVVRAEFQITLTSSMNNTKVTTKSERVANKTNNHNLG